MVRSLGKSFFLHHQRASWESLIAGASSSRSRVDEAEGRANRAEKAYGELARWAEEVDEKAKKLEGERERLLVSEAMLRKERDTAREDREVLAQQVRTL